MWLDNDALAERGWILDGTPASQVKWLPSSTLISLYTRMTVETFPPKTTEFFLNDPSGSDNRKEYNVHGKTLIFLHFAKQLPRGRSVNRDYFSLKSE